ncbi:hypothetical protein WA026_010100 [Henosepilachna vigintioctopunctata]|uniref:snRNA-activating protein complex subunit 3 n=1 Tax=Henosepilachna vigintioctopunctata TaxID=420089 RepID=A0AAW1U9C0_9CUCU
MDAIYPPERFKTSELVNLSEHFADFSNYISTDVISFSNSDNNEEKKVNERSDSENNMLKAMGLDHAISSLDSLETACSVDHLLCEGEIKKRQLEIPEKFNLRSTVFEGLPFQKRDVNLEVLKKMDEIQKIRSCEKLLLLNKDNFHNPVIETSESSDVPNDMTPCSDFVVNVFLYKPFCYNFQTKNYSEKFRFSHEIQLLGRNKLTELRDIIVCSSDSGLQAEVESPTDDISHLLKAKEKYPSGCFFIEGVFYNDMRSPNANDYSEVIIKWAVDRRVGHFTSQNMHFTKLEDLSLRFGYPYVYLHQGDCEHIMVFADAHLLTSNDCLISKQYPRIYTMNKSNCVMCYICNLFVARWLVKEYARLPQSITFLCTKCTQSYCYKDGVKIGEFKLYPVFYKSIDTIQTSDEQRSISNTT